MVANTLTWFGGTGLGNVGSYWVSGNAPNSGDTAIITAGTVLMPLDATFSANTVEIAGTAGTAAALVTNGDASITLGNPTVDQATTIESQVQGQTAAGTTLLDTLGTFINQGAIEANGTTGSTFTIDVSEGTTGNPGAFINEGQISVAAGNAMTIAVGTNAAFYNASDIQVTGGTLDITTIGTGQFDGGYAPVHGVVVMSGGATVEDNIAYGTTVSGPPPVFAFADGTDTLKLDQQAQFGGVILNFTAGDTIDLGKGLTVTGTTYAATGVLTLQDGTTTVSSLIMDGGAYTSASFQTTLAASGDLLLTTTGTNVSWTAGGGGSFNTGTNWSGGVAPDATSAAVIGLTGGTLTGTITTSGSQTVRSLLLVGQGDTLAVSGSLGTGALTQGGGAIAVTGGATLHAAILQQIGGGAVQLGTGAQLNVTGAANLGFANAGTLTSSAAGLVSLLLQGSALIDGGTVTAGGLIDIGLEGGGAPAQMTVTAGGLVTDTETRLNSGPTSFGSLTLSGSGTKWIDAGSATDPNNQSGYMIVGGSPLYGVLPAAGAAGLTVTQGATLIEQGVGSFGAFAKIGEQPDTAGIANVSSGGVWDIGLANGGFLQVGAYGGGALDIAGGTVAVGGSGTSVVGGVTSAFTGGIGIGRFGGGLGTAAVNGGLLTSADGIAVGYQGDGALSVSGGGRVLVTANGIGVGISAGSLGTLSVSDTGSGIAITGGGLSLGKAGGSGAMTIGSGAAVAVAAGGGLFLGGTGAGASSGGSGSIHLANDGTLDVNGNAYLWNGSALSADGASGIDLGSSGSFVAGAVVVEAGHSLIGDGVVAAAVLASGAILATNNPTLTAATGGVLELAGGVSLDAGATITVASASGLDIGTSGSLISGEMLVEGGHALGGIGRIDATTVDDGTIQAGTPGGSGGGTLEIAGAVSGSGLLGLAGGATLRIDGSLAASPTLGFANDGLAETLILGLPGSTVANAITGFAAGDRIELATAQAITGASLNGTTLMLGLAGGGTETLSAVSLASGTAPILLTGTDAATGLSYVALSPATPRTLDWLPSNGSTNFANAGNWLDQTTGTVAALPPGPLDTAVFQFSGPVVTGTGTAGTLVFDNFGTTTLAAGAALTATNEATLASGVLLVAAGASLVAQGTLATAGSDTLDVVGSVSVGGALNSLGGLTGGVVEATGGGRLQVAGVATVAGGTLSVDGTSAIDIGGGSSVAAGGILIEAGHALEGNGTIAAPGTVLDSGTIIAAGGTLEIAATVAGTGALELGLSSALQLDSGIGGGLGVVFQAGAPGTLIVAQPGSGLSNPIIGFAGGDAIAFGGGMVISSASLNAGTLTLVTNTGGTAGTYVLTNFGVVANAPTTFVPGTLTNGDAYVSLRPRIYDWTGATSGALDLAGNWNDITDSQSPALTPPSAGDTASFTGTGTLLTGTVAVASASFDGGAWGLASRAQLSDGQGLVIGSSQATTLTVGAGASLLTASGTGDEIGANSGTGTVTVAGLWNAAAGLSVGFNTYGSLAVAGGTLIAGSFLDIGTASSGAGANVTLNTGTIVTASLLVNGTTHAGNVAIGSGGSLLITSAAGAAVGSGAFESGAISVGAGGLLAVAGAGSGTGLLVGGNGAAGALGTGAISVSGAGARVALGATALLLGANGGSGGLTITAGGSVAAASATLGQAAGDTGLIGVSGSTSAMSLTGALLVGDGGGIGGLTLTTGGTVTAGSATIGQNGGTGAVGLAGPGTTLDVAGPLVIAAGTSAAGTIAVTAGAMLEAGGLALGQGGTLAVDASSYAEIGGAGNFVAGQLAIDAGQTAQGAGLIAAALTNSGVLEASGGTLEITGPIAGAGTLAIGGGATLRQDNNGLAGSQAIAFLAGAAETLILGQPYGTLTNQISGFALGDRIEFGGLSGLTGATINGTTLSVSGTIAGAPGSVVLSNLSSSFGPGTTLVTGVDPTTGDSYVQLASNSVWQWSSAIAGAATLASNWSLKSGSGNASGTPQPGDTAIIPFGTVIAPVDAQFVANTIELGGTAGVVAAGSFTGDTAITWSNPSVDSNALIETSLPGQTTAAQSLLEIAGRFVNQGSILANGTTGSSTTITIGQGTSGIAGALINYGEIDVLAGNTMTIAAGAGAAFFNAGLVMIQGGGLDLTTSGTGALAGGLAPTDGLFVLQSGGTLEVNTGSLGGTTGVRPLIAFADTSNNLLKLDQPGQFNARLLGFGTGDTIDLGAIAATTLVSNANGLLSVENAGGTTLASLVFGTGAFTPGTIVVSGSTAASGFIVTDTAGDIRISAGLTNDVWSGGSGTWGASGTNWSAGTVAATGDTALIVSNGTTDFAVGTGTGAITVNGLVVADGHAALQIADAMTVTPTPVQLLGGTIEVQGTASLTASAIDQASRGASLLLDQGATVDLTGHPGIGFSNNGTLAVAAGGTIGLQAMGTVTVTGAVLNAGAGTGGSGGFISIGQGGGGTGATMLVQDGSNAVGAHVTDTYAYLSSDPTSFGSLTISGPNTSWTDAGDAADPQTTRGYMVVGDNAISKQAPAAGPAQLTVTAGATLTETSYAIIGKSGDSAGSATVSDYGNWLIGTGAGQPGFLDVGRSGQGSLLISAPTGSDGGVVAVGGGGTILSQGTTVAVPYAVDIGANAGAMGSVTVSGGVPLAALATAVQPGITSGVATPRGSTLTAAGQINVGDAGTGTLQVTNGGLVDVTTASGIVLGNQAGGLGGVLVDGAVIEAATGSLVVGQAGTGALAIQNSGQAYFATASVKNEVLVQTGGLLDVSGGLTVQAGGWIGGGTSARIGTHAATGTVVNLGTIEAASGALGVNGTLAGSGTLQIDPGATMVVGGSIAGTDSFVFATGAAPAALDFVTTGPTLTNSIQNLQAGDEIVLENFSTITGATVNGTTLTVTGTLTGGTGPSSVALTNVGFAAGVAQSFTATTATDPFTAASGGAIQLACFAAGTPIATAAGETPVERLRAGDLVRTASGGLRPVRWIGHRRIDLTRHPDPRRARPIRIGADAIADGAPARDLLLSPDHAILYRGGLIPVRLLVNDSTIRRETRTRAVTYYHVELDSHDVLLAAGLAAESYLDTGNRGIFANADTATVLHPDFLSLTGQDLRESRSCAPFVADPARAEAAWRALADRAIALGCPPPEPAFSAEPALALAIGARRLRPLGRAGATYRFAVPAGVAPALVSRAAYPQDARPWEEDQRRLGVMVRRLTLHRNGTATDLPLDHPALDRGWWAPESDGVSAWRWTDGAAALPRLDAPAELVVELAGTLAYPLPARGAVRNPDRRSAAAE